jgi:hypothetical protein
MTLNGAVERQVLGAARRLDGAPTARALAAASGSNRRHV